MKKDLQQKNNCNNFIHDYFITFVMSALIILMFLLVKGSFENLEGYKGSKGVVDFIFIGITIALGGMLYLMNKRRISNRKIIISLIFIGVIIRAIYAFGISSRPVSDFAIMYNTAGDILNGDFSNLWGIGYIARFPHITIPTLYFALIRAIFPNSLLAIKFFNVIASTCNIVIIYLIIKELFNCEIKAQVAALITTVYPPIILYTAIYTTENLAIPLFLLGIYLFLLVTNGKKDYKYLIAAVVFVSIGNLFRKVGQIIIVAFVLYIIVSYRETIRKKLLSICIVILGFMIPYLSLSMILHNTGIIEYQLWKGSEPAITNIVKGLNIEHSGHWNEEDAVIPETYDFDYDKITEVCKEIIHERLTETDFSKLVNFLEYKFVSQWTIADFSGSYWAEHGLEDSEISFKYSENGIWFGQLFFMMLIILVYIGLFNVKGVKENRGIALIYYIFCGYGILYLISENQARYGFVVCWIFIIMAIGGIDFIENIMNKEGELYGEGK